jgi:hypothetical protein
MIKDLIGGLCFNSESKNNSKEFKNGNSPHPHPSPAAKFSALNEAYHLGEGRSKNYANPFCISSPSPDFAQRKTALSFLELGTSAFFGPCEAEGFRVRPVLQLHKLSNLRTHELTNPNNYP